MEKQIEVHKNGVSCGKELLIICCSNRYEYSIQTGDWYITDNIKFVISKSLHFSGHVSNECALEKLRQIKSAEILANTSVKLEEKLDNIPAVPKESLLGKQKWYISGLYGGKLTQIHMKRAIKILIPREYVSRERLHRHMAANYLPGHMSNAYC